MKHAAAFLVLALAALPVAAQPSAPREETVSVTGTGKSSVEPDRVTFRAGVQTTSDSVERAIQQNNERMAKVLAALKSASAQEKEIQTSGFSIYPQQDHRPGAAPRITGYQVSNTVTVRSDKPAEAGKLLQAAVNAGVNTASGLQFEVTDPAKGRDEALRAAYADARAKADLLARAAGRTLGKALRITESSQPDSPPPRPMAMRAEAAADVPVAAGTIETSYTVSAVFELR